MAKEEKAKALHAWIADFQAKVPEQKWQLFSDDLDQLIYYLLFYAGTTEQANEAFAALKNDHEFSDWNEVRVATYNEIYAALNPKKFEHAAWAARVIKGLLEGVWKVMDVMSLESVREENLELEKADLPKDHPKDKKLSLKETRDCKKAKILSIIDAIETKAREALFDEHEQRRGEEAMENILPPWGRNFLLAQLGYEQMIPYEQHTAKVLEQVLNIVDTKHSIERRQKQIKVLLGDKMSVLELHYHFVQSGKFDKIEEERLEAANERAKERAKVRAAKQKAKAKAKAKAARRKSSAAAKKSKSSKSSKSSKKPATTKPAAEKPAESDSSAEAKPADKAPATKKAPAKAKKSSAKKSTTKKTSTKKTPTKKAAATAKAEPAKEAEKPSSETPEADKAKPTAEKTKPEAKTTTKAPAKKAPAKKSAVNKAVDSKTAETASAETTNTEAKAAKKPAAKKKAPAKKKTPAKKPAAKKPATKQVDKKPAEKAAEPEAKTDAPKKSAAKPKKAPAKKAETTDAKAADTPAPEAEAKPEPVEATSETTSASDKS